MPECQMTKEIRSSKIRMGLPPEGQGGLKIDFLGVTSQQANKIMGSTHLPGVTSKHNRPNPDGPDKSRAGKLGMSRRIRVCFWNSNMGSGMMEGWNYGMGMTN